MKLNKELKSQLKILDIISFLNDTNLWDKINTFLGGEDNYDFILSIHYHVSEGKTNTLIDLLSFNMVIYYIPIPIGIIEYKSFGRLQIRPKISLHDIYSY